MSVRPADGTVGLLDRGDGVTRADDLVGLMMLPAAAARFWANRVEPMCLLALAIGFASCIAGLLISYYGNLPSGPAIILVAGIAYVLSLLLGRHGSLRRRLLAPAHLEA